MLLNKIKSTYSNDWNAMLQYWFNVIFILFYITYKPKFDYS